MRVLVTNDDGIDSPGLLCLKQALDRIGEVSVVAPERNWSAAGHTKTLDKPLRVTRHRLADGQPGLATDGTPSDSVALALLGVLADRPDLVVSGINKGPNLGGDITYSGTVAAAMEAVLNGIPGIAVSLDAHAEWDFRFAAEVAARIADQVLRRRLETDVLLNVNVPHLPADQIRGVKITRLGHRIYRDVLLERQDPRGQTYYWIGGEMPTGRADEGTDVKAVADGYVSITPIHLDLTNHHLIAELQSWDLSLGDELGTGP